MNTFKNGLCALTFIFTSNSFAENCSNGVSMLTPTDFWVPNGYNLQSKNDGICIYRKNGENTYIQVIDLAGGANVKFLTGKFNGNETLPNGKTDKVYQKQSIVNFLSSAINSSPKIFSVVNGQFFGDAKFGSFLSFPVKSNGNIISEGPDMRDWDSSMFRTIRIYEKSSSWLGIQRAVKVYPYYDKSEYSSLSGNVIVGAHPTLVDKGKNSLSGRTFIAARGGMNNPSNGEYPILIIGISEKTTQSSMNSIMQAWGANSLHIVMFDGGGSTQYKDVNGFSFYGISAGQSYPDMRNIPMVFEVHKH